MENQIIKPAYCLKELDNLAKRLSLYSDSEIAIKDPDEITICHINIEGEDSNYIARHLSRIADKAKDIGIRFLSIRYGYGRVNKPIVLYLADEVPEKQAQSEQANAFDSPSQLFGEMSQEAKRKGYAVMHAFLSEIVPVLDEFKEEIAARMNTTVFRFDEDE
ncbi:hypothetical protein SAMN05421780_11119 [Flexibacter flexilis DSM 6793]|uniref:Uncharacterized protein n=1 Tax=Flexibacter flexilis DSM 6793 TaxID=927664 RepID=A0A1I1MQ07_9BACT|nr:hypothetical protein [Flexibacter flexilis]SFC86952.1 hypothetical protein SAMN05421780_11119 [Flexibacter flexilis DSM 6793]